MVYIHEKIELCSYDKVLSVAKEQIACFASEAEMHKHCAQVSEGLERKGMSFHGNNVSRYFEYGYRVLSDDEIKFVFGSPSCSHIGKRFK